MNVVKTTEITELLVVTTVWTLNPVIRWDKATMVRETVRTYTQRLPAPAPSSAPRQEARRQSEEEVAGEIIELKRALNTARSAGGSADIYLDGYRRCRYC